MMRFYRGIALRSTQVATVMEAIRTTGLGGGEGRWAMTHASPFDIEAVFLRADLDHRVIRPGLSMMPAICASGDFKGAKHYACKHNFSDDCDAPVIIEFLADTSDVVIDGKDFLYTCFGSGAPERARRVLEHAFGHAILRYAERAWEEPASAIACGDLAIRDPEVVSAHYRNTLTLEGRNRIPLRNAFTVSTPIRPERILGVTHLMPTYSPRLPDVILQDVLR